MMPEEQNHRSVSTRDRKVMIYDLKLKSENLYRHLSRDGAKGQGAFDRIGSLIRMLTRNPELGSKLSEWLDEIMSEAHDELLKMIEMKSTVAELLTFEIPPVEVPDKFSFKIEITHPVSWRLINLLQELDKVLDELEVLYLAGILDDAAMDNARRQANQIINRVVTKIFIMTKPGKREGGRFDPTAFIESLKGEQVESEISTAAETELAEAI